MKGQWIGRYSGDHTGDVMVNIDLKDGVFLGQAFSHPDIQEDNIKLPSTAAYFIFSNEKTNDINVNLQPIDQNFNIVNTWEEIKDQFHEDVNHSNSTSMNINFVKGNLKATTTTDLNAEFKFDLKRSNENTKSTISSKKMSWQEFKNHVFDMREREFIFRGQRQDWSLRTTFHRLGRYRIDRFLSKDITELHQRLSGITKHFFNLDDGKQNGAFFNLLQHHGYPTPLLDWSRSPFVAAFFAFKDTEKDTKNTDNIRIFLFNNKEWKNNFNQARTIDPTYPYLSVTDFIALENPRTVPQQALTTITNLVDIEEYIKEMEGGLKIKFIYAIDIPIKDRNIALRELALMGITSGSMFPGIDGICEEFKEKNF